MKINGSIGNIISKVSASGDIVNVIKLEFDESTDVRPLHELLKKPLSVTFELMQMEFGKITASKKSRKEPKHVIPQ